MMAERLGRSQNIVVTLLILLTVSVGAHDFPRTMDEFRSQNVTFEELFQTFIIAQNKTYQDAAESQNRYRLFSQNMARVLQWNSHGSHSFTLAMNHLGDLSAHEYRRLLGALPTTPVQNISAGFKAPRQHPQGKLQAVPDAIDYRDYGYVSPVKNQGQCGSCWSFSITGQVESLHRIFNDDMVSLSEQMLIECCGGGSNCSGYYPTTAADCAMNTYHGLDSDASYGYNIPDLSKTCTGHHAYDLSASYSYRWNIKKEDENDLQSYVGQYQPVSVSIDASKASFASYSSGVYVEKNCSNTGGIDHAVLVVGYGFESTGATSFCAPSKDAVCCPGGAVSCDKGYLCSNYNTDDGSFQCVSPDGSVAEAEASIPMLMSQHTAVTESDCGCGTEKKCCYGAGGPYWLVKNSWGSGWGEKGYIRMQRNHSNMCSIASEAWMVQ